MRSRLCVGASHARWKRAPNPDLCIVRHADVRWVNHIRHRLLMIRAADHPVFRCCGNVSFGSPVFLMGAIPPALLTIAHLVGFDDVACEYRIVSFFRGETTKNIFTDDGNISQRASIRPADGPPGLLTGLVGFYRLLETEVLPIDLRGRFDGGGPFVGPQFDTPRSISVLDLRGFLLHGRRVVAPCVRKSSRGVPVSRTSCEYRCDTPRNKEG